MTDGEIRLTCPRCGERIENASGRGRVSFSSEIRVPVDCPACAAGLEIVVQPELPDAIETVNVWTEDRREDEKTNEADDVEE